MPNQVRFIYVHVIRQAIFMASELFDWFLHLIQFMASEFSDWLIFWHPAFLIE